jgi:hypothetical protein
MSGRWCDLCLPMSHARFSQSVPAAPTFFNIAIQILCTLLCVFVRTLFTAATLDSTMWPKCLRTITTLVSFASSVRGTGNAVPKPGGMRAVGSSPPLVLTGGDGRA